MPTPSRVLLPFLSVCCVLLAGPGSAFASEYWVNTNESDSKIYKVDTGTGSWTLVGATGVAFLTDIAFAPDGSLYATDGSSLYSVNTSTGAGSFIGSIGAIFIAGLDFDDAGTLWGVDEGSNEVWTIDTGTGSGTFEFGTGIVFNGDVAHDAGDIFYASGQFLLERNLFELDVVAQSGADQGLIATGTFAQGLDFDDNGDLFVFMNDGDIYQVASPATSGAGTFVSSITPSIATVSGASFPLGGGGSIPTPALPSAALVGVALALGGLGAWVASRRSA